MCLQMQHTRRLALWLSRWGVGYDNAQGPLFVSRDHEHLGVGGDNPVAILIGGILLDLLQRLQIEYIYMGDCHDDDSMGCIFNFSDTICW